jgi:hypothetical protein
MQPTSTPQSADRIAWLMFAVTAITCAAFIAGIIGYIY